MKKTLVRIIVVCIAITLLCIIAPNAHASQGSTNSTSPLTWPTINTSEIPVIASPSSGVTPPNSINSPNSTIPNPNDWNATPLPNANDNGSVNPLTTYTPWLALDLWSNPNGQDMPASMSGAFTAVSNTIGNLVGNDVVFYLPLNVAYGTSPSSFVWFQFAVQFGANGAINWYLYSFPNGNINDPTQTTVGISYIIGHSYSFSFTTSGSNTVIFNIQDTTLNSTPWTYPTLVPGVSILYWPNGCFSPASAVEGDTTYATLTNVPTFSTTLGTAESTYYYAPSQNINNHETIDQGVGSNVAIVSSVYYWAMVPETYSSSYIGYTPLGTGASISNPSALSGVPDTQCAGIYAPNSGSGEEIEVALSTSSGGNLYVDGYSDTGYNSLLYAYVYTGSSWVQVGSALTVCPSGEFHIWIGTYSGSFTEVAVVGYDNPNPVDLSLDAVALFT